MSQPTDDMIDQGFDDTGDLYVNFSDDEAASESRDMEPLPSGKYLVTITNVELKESQSAKNPGKPMYSFEFTVVDDKTPKKEFRDRKCWTLAMLFPPALFTITHIMKATGFPVASGRQRIPSADEFIGKTLLIGGTKRGEQKDKNDPTKTYAPRFEPQYFASAEKWSSVPAAAGSATGKAGNAASSLLS